MGVEPRFVGSVLTALVVPPVAILVHANAITQQFTINVLLLVVYAVGAGVVGHFYGPKEARWTGLLGIAAAIHALWVIVSTPPGANGIRSGQYAPLVGNASAV